MRTRKTIVSFLLVLPLALPAHPGPLPEGRETHRHAEHQGMTNNAPDEHAEHRRLIEEAAKARDVRNVEIELRDLELRDQEGRRRRLKSDVIGDKLVAMTFTYSTCTTICPIYSALFTEIQRLLGERMERDVVLVTITLDPTTDVPLRLKREANKYRAKPGWFFLTGEKKNVDQVLRGLDAYFADFTQHPPMALVGDGKTGTWMRYNGFPRPEQVVAMLDELEAARDKAGGGGNPPSAAKVDAAHSYFTDVVLINQDGDEVRFYSDLMKDKVVVISVIFTTCEGVCPVTMGNLVKIQNWLGPRLGKDVHMLSLTVDRETDTPERLRAYARKFKAKPGWQFLTGSPENLDLVLRKLGLWVRDKEAHSTTFLIGNVPTGLWKKALGMAQAQELIAIVDSVLDDELAIDTTVKGGR